MDYGKWMYQQKKKEQKARSHSKQSELKEVRLRPKIDIHDLSEKLFSQYLYTNDIEDPDLLIRTGKEHRISNFLLWQIAYAELYFTETLWPDFRKKHLEKAILEYQKRERRFGKTTEQINNENY